MQKSVVRAERNKVVRLERSRSAEVIAPASLPTGNRPIVRVHLLGAMRATTYLGDSILPRGRKARAILGYLCLAAGQSVPRGRLAAMLWDRVPDTLARASFRQSLRELVTAMGPLAEELIFADRETVRLKMGPCWIDALAVLATVSSSATALRSDLAALCSGELLEGLDGASASFDHWLLSERTLFAEQLRALHEAELNQLDNSDVDPKQRALIARRVITFDATHEGASRTLMRALADMGERAQALKEYARCRDALRHALDVEPSPETQALHEAVRMYTGRDDGEKVTTVPAASAHRNAEIQVQASTRSRLRVGVLPFLAMRAPRDESLALSISQEIAAALARFRWFDVIAPVGLMCRPMAGLSGNDPLPSNELDYVVDGALSSNGEKYQISVRLLDLARYASPVWSDRFELAVSELHRVDEVVTARIVGRIDPVILFIEGQPKRREKYGATGLLLLAIPLLYSMERTKFEEAGRLIYRALESDPDNAMVLAWASYWQMWHVGQGWTQDVRETLTIAQNLCLKAIRIDPDNAEALGILAHTLAWKKEFQSALHFFDRSLRLNPNLAYVWALSAATFCYLGEPDTAIERMDRYRDLAPFDPYFCFFECIYTIAYAFKGEYEQAVIVGTRAVNANPEFTNGYKPLIASLGHLGRRQEAKPFIEKLRSLEPTFTIQRFVEVYPFHKESDRDRYIIGLRRAGVPES